MGRMVMTLRATKRQHEKEWRLKRILAAQRAEPSLGEVSDSAPYPFVPMFDISQFPFPHIKPTLTEQDATFLCRYHLGNTETIKPDQAKQIANDETTLFLFAKNEPRIAYNRAKLREVHTPNNPVARVRPHYTDDDDIPKQRQPRHFDNQVDPATYICRNARVEIKGRNILPQLGLYNGAMGTVLDIVYNEGENPNEGDLPRYVLVRLPSYKGPAFLPNDPKVVPVIPISRSCDRKSRCCRQHYIPLKLCFAKTLHSYQGQNAGPTAPGQPQNPIQRLVIDLGDRKFEGNNPGLSYTAFSRVTQLGHENDIMDSALYFIGPDMRPSRILNITKKTDGTTYKKVLARSRWVQYLNKHVITPSITPRDTKAIFDWASNHRPDRRQIELFHDLFLRQSQ
jgi:hypothetical protein